MKNFKVEIKETLSRIIEVNATNLESALSKVKEDYDNEKIVLTSEDYIDVEIDIFGK